MKLPKYLDQYLSPYGYIYMIENVINEKKYIGQTTNEKGVRGIMTLIGIQCAYKENLYLINAVKKYGVNNFRRYIVDNASNKKELDQKEDLYIKKYSTLNRDKGYNLKHGGSHGKHSKETRIKISLKMKGKNHPMYGKHLSEKTKKKLSESHKGEKNGMYGKVSWNKNKQHPLRIKKKISETLKQFIFSKEYLIQQYWITEYHMNNHILNINQKNLNQIAKENNCSRKTISRNLIKYDIPIRNQSYSKKLWWSKK